MPSPSSGQQVLSALHRAMPLAWVGQLHSCYLQTFDVSFVNLCTLESDPTKALPKDSSLSYYSLHKLHLSSPQLLLPPRENFPYAAYYALYDELQLKPKKVQMNKITHSAFFL